MKRFVGFLIGAGFGLAFVLANSGPPLDTTLALVLRVLAVAALLAIIALTVSLSRRPAPGTDTPQEGPRMRFGAFYGVVVALEVVLILGGIQALRAMEAPMQANVAWIALVVGVHFLPLAWYWRARSILGAAVYISALGAVGLAMALADRPDWVPFVSGVTTGLGILTGILVSLLLMRRAASAAEASPALPS